MPGQAFVKDATERVEVRWGFGVAAGQLLGRCVGDGPTEEARCGQGVRAVQHP